MKFEQAAELAKKHAKQGNEPYCHDAQHDSSWQAHEWVVSAVLEAYRLGVDAGLSTGPRKDTEEGKAAAEREKRRRQEEYRREGYRLGRAGQDMPADYVPERFDAWHAGQNDVRDGRPDVFESLSLGEYESRVYFVNGRASTMLFLVGQRSGPRDRRYYAHPSRILGDAMLRTDYHLYVQRSVQENGVATWEYMQPHLSVNMEENRQFKTLLPGAY